MKKTIGTLCAAAILAVSISIAVASPALAGPGACVLEGNTVEYCNEHYLSALESTGIDYSAETAIRLGHTMADYFEAHPNKLGFVTIVNRLIKDQAQGNCAPGTTGCHPDPINVDQAVFIVQRAVMFWGPPGLADTMDSAMAAG
ncbi:MAG: hypothetical protein WAL26_21725 [Mycobacterium sp.]